MNGRTGQNCLAAAILGALICLAFSDIAFLGRTLVTANMEYGTMPSGAYGYTGRRVLSIPVIDRISAWQYEPYVKVLHDDVAHHWLPLWDPYVGAGAPLLANMAPAVLSPMRLMLAAAGKPGFWDFYLLLRLFIAALFAYLFARELGFGLAGSLVAGIAFGLSGHFVYFINMPDLDVQIWLPAMLLAAHKFVERPTYGKFVITALLTALIILGGMPESAFFVFLLATLYLLFCLWKLPPPEERKKFWRRKRLIGFAGAGIAGFLISLPQVLPFVEFLQNASNPRAPGVGMADIPAGTTPSLFMPTFFGQVHDAWNRIDVIGPRHILPYVVLPYVGGVCLLFAFAGICRKGSSSRLTWFFAGFATFYLLKAFGIPPVQWVGRLPLFNMSLFPKHAFPEFSLCMAMLAGMGAEHILKRQLNYSRFLLASILLALTVIGFVAYHWNKAVYFGGLQDLTKSCVVFDITFALVWILVMAARRSAASKMIAVALVLLPAAELAAFIPRGRADRYDDFTQPPFVDFLQRDRQPYRIFSLDKFLSPNTNAAYGVEDIRILDPLQVSRYKDLLRADFNPSVYDGFDSSGLSREIFRSPLLDLMNVKYVLAVPEAPIQGLDSSKFDLVYDREVRIYQNKNVLPRAFVASRAEMVSDKDQILRKLTEPGFNPRQTVLLEEPVTNDVAATSAASAQVNFERYEPNYIRLQATLTHSGWLVLTDTYYPGWKVLIDGKPGRILPADHVFRAVHLEPGAHAVEFVYRPASFVWGVGISSLTAGILICIPIGMRWPRRGGKPGYKPRYKPGHKDHLDPICAEPDFASARGASEKFATRKLS